VTHGWQSESIDGPNRKVAGVVFLGVVAIVAVVTSPQLLDVVWCSVVVGVVVGVVVVVIVVVSCSCNVV